MKQEKNIKAKDGITLIALVITIIVLLILAGVTLATLTGDNGLLNKASDAKEETQVGGEIEGIKLAVSDARIGENGYQDLTYDSFKKAISQQFGDNTDVIQNADGTFLVKFEDRTYNVSSNGSVFLEDNLPKWNGQKEELTSNDLDENDGYYKISNASQLAWLAYSVNNNIDNGMWSNKNYKLECDIDLNGSELQQWIMIGTATNSFSGIFDGKGHSIKNLYVNNTDLDRFGLFGQIASTATIKNIKLLNCNITASNRVGGIVGANKGGTIENCCVTGKIFGTGNYIGGILGTNTNGNIKSCYNKATINGTSYIGGIAGSIWADEVQNCYNLGNVTGSRNLIGGIAGYSAGKIINSYNIGNVSSQSSLEIDGIVALTTEDSVKNSYCLENKCENIKNGTMKTKEEMLKEEFISLLNADGNYWKKDTNNINSGYPILKWQ